MGGICVQIPGEFTQKLTLHEGQLSEVATSHGRLTLKPAGILKLAQHGYHFDISNESISDKYKADSLAKVLVYIQILWFVCQTIQRKIAHLPISILEFHVLVNIGCGLVVYTMWFKIPRNVDTATVEDVFLIERLVPEILDSNGYGNFPKLFLQMGYSNRIDWAQGDDHGHDMHTGLPKAAMWVCREGGNRPEESNAAIEVVAGPSVTISIIDPENMKDGAAADLSKRLREDLQRNLLKENNIATKQPSANDDRSNTDYVHPKPKELSELNLVGEQGIVETSDRKEFPAQKYSCQSDKPPLDERKESSHPGLNHTEQPLPSFPQLQSLEGHSAAVTPRIFSMIRLGPNCFCPRRGNFSYLELLETRRNGSELIVHLACFHLAISGYGAIHVIPSVVGFRFPSPIERSIWDICCIFIVGVIFFLPVAYLVVTILGSTWYMSGPKKWEFILFWLGLLYLVLLIAARLYLMVESFISLRKERIEVFQTPEWNWLDYIPHI